MTEKKLSNAFEELILSERWSDRYPAFAHFCRELDCQQGRPDYVASSSKVSNRLYDFISRLEMIEAPTTAAKILSLLKPLAPRTLPFLQEKSGLSAGVVRRTLNGLELFGLVKRVGKSGFALPPVLVRNQIELWAFEVKVNNWQRALYQALQYRAFAHRVFVVLSESSAKRVENRIDLFKDFGVGVIAIDPYKKSYRVIVKGKKFRPSSRSHYFYALGKFIESSR